MTDGEGHDKGRQHRNADDEFGEVSGADGAAGFSSVSNKSGRNYRPPTTAYAFNEAAGKTNAARVFRRNQTRREIHSTAPNDKQTHQHQIGIDGKREVLT